MDDLRPKRKWSLETIGVKVSPDPISRGPGDVGVSTPLKIVEAGVVFRNGTTVTRLEEDAAVVPSYMEERKALARKALWRHIHEGLDGPLFEILLRVRRAKAVGQAMMIQYPLASVEVTSQLAEAEARVKVLIDHVLGNERPVGQDGWSDDGFHPEPSTMPNPEPEPRTEEPDGLDGARPGD